MTIVTASPPKRQRVEKRARPMQLQQGIVMAHKQRKRVRAEHEIDPKEEVRVQAFLARMIQPPGR